MIKCCIFDLDGTLLYTLPTITYYLNETLVEYGLSPVSESECCSFIGDGARVLIERALKAHGIEDGERCEELLINYKKRYDDAPLYLTRVYEGIEELIDKLRGEGIALAVLSNKPHEATEAVVKHYFADSFDIVMGAVEGVPLKPRADAAEKICDALRISQNNVAFVGDTAVDIETAKNMGSALSVGVLWGYRNIEELSEAGADVIAKEPSEIYKA